MGKNVDKDVQLSKQRRVTNPANQAQYAITILSPQEAVRKRPEMYIGSTTEPGLHYLVYEGVDNAVNAFHVGVCEQIEVTIHGDSSITVKDNGEGISVDQHRKEGKPFAEIALTVLCCGGSMRRYGAPHGIGLSVVNSLSERLRLIIWRDGARYEQDYERGVALYNLRRIRETTRHGTKITFKPDPQIFQVTEFNYRLLSERLRETAYLNPGLRISLSDERIDRGDEFFFRNGIADFVRLLNKNKAVLPDEPIHLLREPSDEEPLGIEIALQYASYCSERVTSFANYIKTIEGGTHATGFRAGLARAIETHARLSDQSKRSTRSLNAEDVFEGLVAVVSVKLSQPQFSDWTRARLDSEITDQVEAFVSERLGQYFREHPSMAQKIVDKVVRAVCDARRSETR